MKWMPMHSGVEIPMYQTRLASGMDIKADIKEELRLYPHSILSVPTGLQVYLKEDEELQIRPRSGLAFNRGITVLNAPGTIDSDYELEIRICLINHSEDLYVIKPKERIAQAILANVVRAPRYIHEQDRIGGFGSTGTVDHHPV